MWSDLIADQGQILRCLLKRLLHVASVPNWRVALLREGGDDDQLAAWFRIPLVIYWYPALRVVSRHAQAVATHALRNAAEACVLWLRNMPLEMPGRPPTRAVCDGFQSAVLDGLGLRTLVAVRPAAAKEVLLVVCIEEPIRVDPLQ